MGKNDVLHKPHDDEDRTFMIDLMFWAGQAVCAAGLAYGAYLSMTCSERAGPDQDDRTVAARLHHLATA
jgi:hypothetical protein